MAIQKNNAGVASQQMIRYVAVGALAVAAFFGAYRFAQAQSAKAETSASPTGIVASAAAPTGGAGAANTSGSGGGCNMSGGAGGGCCGSGGGSTATVPGKTAVAGSVQKVTIDLTTGSYSPNRITAKAGIPIELDFKGPASGCNGTVVSQQLGFQQDVSNGGTIEVGPLKPGNYAWTCGMGMYTAQIVVQ